MFFTAGTETYGRVKAVDGTPVVTKFAMLQLLPLWPLESFYRTGKGKSTSTGIPFFASSRTETIRGIPLARIDKTSALIAYIRAICAPFAIVGVVLLVTVLVSSVGRPLEGLAFVILICMAGAAIGLLTYTLPLMRHREREIRRYCGQLLGSSIDPARVRREIALQIIDYLGRTHGPDADKRTRLLCRLIETRATICQTIDTHNLELTTDELLGQLAHADGVFA